MSDNFIPLNQSTPVHNRWQQDRSQQNLNPQNNGNRRGGHNKWRNHSRSSYGSNSSNNSFSQDKHNIDAYLHPSMLQDPWAELRNRNENSSSN